MTDRDYFVETFSPDRADLELLARFIRSEGVPCTTDVLLHRLLQHKLAEGRSDSVDIEELPPDTVIYQKAGDYRVNQRIYIASEGRMAIVERKEPKPYATPRDGGRTTFWHKCQCIEVRLADGTVKQFICAAPFLESALPAKSSLGDLIELRGRQLRDRLKHSLWNDSARRFASFQREWCLRELLVANDEATVQEIEHLLLRRGTPTSVLEIASILFEDVSDPVVVFSLGVLLNSSNLFRRVRESPPPELWFLSEHPTKVDVPKRRAVPSVRRKIIESDPRVVKTEKPRKRRTKTKIRRRRRVELIVPVGYPESGTLPVNSKTSGVFPAGSGEIPLIFIDARSGLRMQGGVSHDDGHSWGLFDWFQAYDIRAGAKIVIERTDDEFVLKVDYVPAACPVTYRLRVVTWQAGELVSFTREFTPAYEVDAEIYEYSTVFEDPKALWAEATDAIFDIICCVFPALAQGDADGAVHYRTISSAVSYVRRCAPSTVWALLSTHECFQHVAGRPGYWSFERDRVIGLEETEIVRNAMLPQVIAVDKEAQALQTELDALQTQALDQAVRLQAMRVT